ncbi:MAG TPA: hypothetical protein VHE35_24920 [Kofleriaceae bacterium]|nr:hypothetical protein [Kofleriaceae bacterium]
MAATVGSPAARGTGRRLTDVGIFRGHHVSPPVTARSPPDPGRRHAPKGGHPRRPAAGTVDVRVTATLEGGDGAGRGANDTEGEGARSPSAEHDHLHAGELDDILAELRRRYDAIPRTGPGTKGRRERLLGALRYLEKRVAKMPCDKILELDIEPGHRRGRGRRQERHRHAMR